MEPLCRVGMLGGLKALVAGREITRFRTQKAGALLGYLAYHLDTPHSREALVDLLWPDSRPEAARTNLRAELSSLRRQLEPPGTPKGGIVRSDRFSVQLNPQAVSTDVAEFEAALDSARAAGSDTERLTRLEEAVAYYRGPLLSGYYQDWILPERERLSDRYFEAVRLLIAALEGLGDEERALDYARRAVAAEPLREEAHRDVMRLLAAAGQPDAALRQYDELRRILDEELAEQPSEATRGLAERLAAAKAREGQVRVAQPAPATVATPAEQPSLPSGTVTFLFTDIVGSRRLGGRAKKAFRKALDTHNSVLREAFRRHGGHQIRELGDGFVAAFEHANDALACAVASQGKLSCEKWPKTVGRLPVRMALYTADVELRGGRYRRSAVDQAARVLAAGHGGQILCSEGTAGLVRRRLASGVHLTDLGSYRLHGVEVPERLFQVSYSGMEPAEFPPLQAEPAYGGELPLSFTRFVGREEELERLGQMLLRDEARIVTLTGPGGCGKTRLAIEGARRLLDSFGGAVWFAPLHDVSDAALVPAAIADALHLPRFAQMDALEQSAAVLARQRSLLVLDNFEQVVDEGTPVVRELLGRAPTLTCLVTSRQCLSLSGEIEFPVDPLPIPADGGTPETLTQCESVRLFVDRAQATRPDFQITDGNAAPIAELCRRLDGIPLALELAAARAQVLTPAQMLAQLADRFDFLVSRKRDAIERHRTLRAAIEWSYQLLPAELQRCFAQLAVFRGGCTAEAAEALCEGPKGADHLFDLCDHSLLTAEEEAGSMRFRMLESIQEFARALLDEEGGLALEERHARYFLEIARNCSAQADGPDEAEAFAEMEADLGNITAAMDWALEGEEHRMAAEFAGALTDFLWRRGYWEEHTERVPLGLQAAERLPRRDLSLMARLLHSLAQVAYDRGDLDSAEGHCDRGLDLVRRARKPAPRAALLNLKALVLRRRDRAPEAQKVWRESLRLFRTARDARGQGMVLHNLARLAHTTGDAEEARELYQKALPLRRESGDLRGTGETQNNLALLAEEAGDLGAAEEAYREALRCFVTVGDVLGIAVALCNLGEIALRTNRADQAIGLLAPARHTLSHLGSVFADHAAQCLREATAEAAHVPEAGHVSWRQALFAAAERALQE